MSEISNNQETVLSGSQSTGSLSESGSIKESDTANFGADVIEQSGSCPVLVDFWAPWCGPCKQLGPLLEKLVGEYGGKIKLVKINVDENKELAAQMRVQSIPMVVAFKGGAPVDGFAGVLPESQLRKFFEKLSGEEGSPLELALEEASRMLADGETQTANNLYLEILSQDPQNPGAHAGVATCFLEAGEVKSAINYLDGLEDEIKNKQEIKSVQSAIELADAPNQLGDIGNLRQRWMDNQSDPQLGIDYATALYADGSSEEAIDILVGLVKSHKDWGEEAARKQLVKIFDALGHSDPLTVEGRRKLSVVLFS